jgi:hypothetical protein
LADFLLGGVSYQFLGTKVFDVPEPGTASRMTIKNTDAKVLEDALEELEISAEIVDSPSVEMLGILPDIRLVASGLPDTWDHQSLMKCASIHQTRMRGLPISESRPRKLGDIESQAHTETSTLL